MYLNMRLFLYVLVGLGVLGAQAQETAPPWINTGYEQLERAINFRIHDRADSTRAMQHRSEWVDELRQGLERATETAPDEATRARLTLLSDKVSLFEDAQALSHTMLQFFYLAIAGALSDYQVAPVLRVFNEVKELTALVQGLVAIQTPGDVDAYKSQIETIIIQELPQYFIHSWVTDKPVLGVKTLLDGLLHDGITLVPISLKKGSVHGGLVSDAYSQALHDWVHGMEFAGRILEHGPLATLLPELRNQLLPLSGADTESQQQIVQAHLLLHETTVNLIEGNTPNTWDDLRRAGHQFIGETLMDQELYKERYTTQFTDYYLRSDEGKRHFFGEKFIEDVLSFGFTFDQLEILEAADGTFNVPVLENALGRVEVKITLDTVFPENLPGYFTFSLQHESVAERKTGDGSIDHNKSLGHHEHTLPPVSVLQKNASDYAWLFQKLGLVPKNRSLKKDPLLPQEIHDLFIQVVNIPGPFVTKPT